MEAILLKTALLVPGDDIIEVAQAALEAAAVVPRPDDVLVICETPLAICQGRIVRLDDLRVSRGARILNWFMNVDSSIGTVYGMQTAIDLAGFWRIFVLACWWPPPCGWPAAGATSTAWPGARWRGWTTSPAPCRPTPRTSSSGPEDPEGVARAAAAALGCGAAVVDANDYGNFEIMGASPGIDEDMVGQVMRRNPQGNDDEQTPLVLVRP